MAKSKSKATSVNAVAESIAAFIGKSMGGLASRKDALQRELADVERQMAGVRDTVMRQFGASEIQFPKAKRAAKKIAKQAAKSARKAMSEETRAKMVASAKRRWAAAKKAGKSALG